MGYIALGKVTNPNGLELSPRAILHRGRRSRTLTIGTANSSVTGYLNNQDKLGNADLILKYAGRWQQDQPSTLAFWEGIREPIWPLSLPI